MAGEASLVGTANSWLTGQATRGAGWAATHAGKPGLLGSAAGWLKSGLTAFGKFGPWGKAATIVGALFLGNKVLGGGNRGGGGIPPGYGGHGAGRYV